MAGAGSLFCGSLEKPPHHRRFLRKMLCLAVSKYHPIPSAQIGLWVQTLPDPSQQPGLVRGPGFPCRFEGLLNPSMLSVLCRSVTGIHQVDSN